MKQKRILLALLMLTLMLTAVLSSCNNDPAMSQDPDHTSSADGTSSGSNVSDDEEFVLFSNLEKKDFGGETITFLVEGDYAETYQSVEICPNEDSPDLISEAVTERNALVEEYFNVNITEIRAEDYGEMLTMVRNDKTSGGGDYDIICPYITTAATLALEGCFLDLYDYDDIHLDMSYWDQTAVEGLSIAGKMYFCTGDFSLLTLGCTHALVYNKTFVDDGRVEDPIQLVKDGEWTYDKLYEMGRKVTGDTDGIAGMSEKDTYGFLLNNNFPTSMYLGSGQRLTGKDKNDLPIIKLSSTSATDVVSKIFNIVNDPQCSVGIESFEGKVTSVWTNATEMVANGNCLFRAISIIDVADLGDYQCSFGLLPIPKYTADQEYYYSNVSIIYASSAALPASNISRADMSATILEAIVQASTNTTKYAYYEQLLKGRKIQDPESEEVLDDIFDHRVYDLGIVYQWGDINTIINTVVWSGNNTFASSLDSSIGTIQSKMDETISFMQ